MKTPNETEYEKVVSELFISDNNVKTFLFKIPGWQPVEIEEALKWIKGRIFEGYFVKYKINIVNKIVELKYWEYGENEPEI